MVYIGTFAFALLFVAASLVFVATGKRSTTRR
jgi:hypothetical protein